MSLNWNAAEAPNWDLLNNYQQQSIIFATMPTGINKVTMDNYREMHARYFKLMRVRDWKPDLELEDFKNAVGLRTNASSKTPAAFGKDLLTQLNEEVETHNRLRATGERL
jgi:hypothetical protein